MPNLGKSVFYILGAVLGCIFYFYVLSLIIPSTIIYLIISIMASFYLSKIKYLRFTLYSVLFFYNLYVIKYNPVYYDHNFVKWVNILIFIFFLLVRATFYSKKNFYFAYKRNLYQYYIISNAGFIFLCLALRFHIVYTFFDYLILLCFIVFACKNMLDYSGTFDFKRFVDENKQRHTNKEKQNNYNREKESKQRQENTNKEKQNNYNREKESKQRQENTNKEKQNNYNREKESKKESSNNKEDELLKRFYSTDDYVVLGVSRSASKTEIRKKYLELIKQYHPDRCKHPKAVEITAQINNAYENIKKL